MTPETLLLASESPRRRELVAQLGLPFRSVSPTCSEELTSHFAIPDQICDLAERKARSISDARSATWLLAADTVVVLDGQILGKPHIPETAIHMLQQLSGRTCEVITGYALVHLPRQHWHTRAVVTRVIFHPLTRLQIETYVASGEPLDKAGAFAVQGEGRHLIHTIEGDFDNVVGLPVSVIKRDMETLF